MKSSLLRSLTLSLFALGAHSWDLSIYDKQFFDCSDGVGGCYQWTIDTSDCISTPSIDMTSVGQYAPASLLDWNDRIRSLTIQDDVSCDFYVDSDCRGAMHTIDGPTKRAQLPPEFDLSISSVKCNSP